MHRNKALKLWQIIQRLLFLRDRPLSLKLLVFLGILVIVPLSIVGIISYSKSSAVLREEASQSSWQIIEQVKSHIEYYIRDFEIDSIRMLNQPNMKKLLVMRNTEEVQQSGIRQPIMQLFKDTAYSRSDLSRITLILDGIMIFDTAGSESAFPAGELEKENWYRDVPMNGDIMLLSRMLVLQHRSEPVISIMKRVIDPQTLEPAGMLIMDVNLKRIQEIADKVTVGRSGYMAILDAEGRYVFHPDIAMLGQPAEFRNADWMLKQDNGYFQTGEEPFYTFSRSAYLNWHLVTIMPSGELNDGVDYIGRTILLTVLATLAAAYLLAIGFAASIVGPIRKLQFFMKRVKDGDFSMRAAVDSKDEIGYLTNDFNQMVEKLQILMEEIYWSKLRESDLSLRQKETELKVLQSQVNPHFLYNSLETVRGMALEREMGDIATLVSSLARLLRYNLNNTSPIVTLREELTICEMYLKIQKFRFEEKLDYRIDVPEWALDKGIVKFSLQPIVENSVIHGMELGTNRVLIRICAAKDGNGGYEVCIEDTGTGMSPARLALIQRDLREKDVIDGGAHIGIINVHRRIMHIYGERYGLKVESRQGAGTSVTVQLPLPEAEAVRRKKGGERVV
ncbi:sensor histidine kinase [Paenibacillus sp. sptzw28]|uniref:sensor histidine kinase n=1 Tax=Paenibacillus sp. sptzw28 TaxID=715179 RepID=UPI001C6E1605|nr:sensor histidine kinase [Paenibacillus sp. sptzw28]QYR20950.1 sensor histidine kinase [Paenibacillus sp. sptzw28]